jgi:N-acetylglucosamine-6-phosphate deacetylase
MTAQARFAVVADRIFDGSAVRDGAAVIIEDEHIVALVDRGDLPHAVLRFDLPEGAWLAPGFVDLQVNGGGGVLFNDQPTVEGIGAIAAAHRRFGTTALLPTLITDSAEKMRAALDAAEQAIGTVPGAIGIHLEGPFLSPQKPGVHSLRHIRSPDAADAMLLKTQRKGATLVTLAPERVPPGFIRELVDAGIRVSLGHSMATYAETRAAMNEGLTGFTHLFNAMRPLESREPGPIAACLESDGTWFGMIVDGVHVDPVMLRLALRGASRPILVTDAMPPVGDGRSEFCLDGERISVRDGKCLRGDGTLAGSVLDMATAVRNCVRLLATPLTDALRFASLHPASFLGLEHRLGRLVAGCRADMVAIDPQDITVLQTWIAGREFRPDR